VEIEPRITDIARLFDGVAAIFLVLTYYKNVAVPLVGWMTLD